MLQKGRGYNFLFVFFFLYYFLATFCVLTCGKFGKLISSGGRQNFAPNLRNFLTRRKHRKQRRRLRSHLYAFTVFRPVCAKFKWQSTSDPSSLVSTHCTVSVSCLPLLCALVAYLSKCFLFFLMMRRCAHCIETCGPLGNPLGRDGVLFAEFDRLLNKLNWFAHSAHQFRFN